MLVAKLRARLEKLIDRVPSKSVFAHLDPDRAVRVRETLLGFAGSESGRAHHGLLTTASRARLEFQRVSDALMELEVGSEATVAEYRGITGRLERVEDEIEGINQDIGQDKRRILDAQSVLEVAYSERARLDRESERASAVSNEVTYVGRVARTLNDLREDLRRDMRGKVMDLINEKFKVLVHDHELIKSIELDDTYTLIFRDAAGRTVGRSSLSSGIKQLAATALLWAMKEVSGHQVPVIIDTPLGRIDRENQENMLRSYYPNLAGQVIVLPTNAEIDDRKYELIRHSVAREYRIHNESGDSAAVVDGTLLRAGS